MIEFDRADRCFENIVVLMTNYTCYGCGLDVTLHGFMKKLHSGMSMVFEGNPKGANELLGFHPYELMEAIAKNNNWPSSLKFDEISLEKNEHCKKEAINSQVISSNVHTFIQNLSIMSNFVYYFEYIKDTIVRKYGPNPYEWPSTLNFARVIRNAFAHGGKIYFENLNSPPVNWKGYNYSPADNGREILFNDFYIPEIVLLLKEIDALL